MCVCVVGVQTIEFTPDENCVHDGANGFMERGTLMLVRLLVASQGDSFGHLEINVPVQRLNLHRLFSYKMPKPPIFFLLSLRTCHF